MVIIMLHIREYIMFIMNHDSGFIIGIANVFSKPLIERTPKISLRKYPSPQNHPLVVLCKGYRSSSQYQVKG